MTNEMEAKRKQEQAGKKFINNLNRKTAERKEARARRRAKRLQAVR